MKAFKNTLLILSTGYIFVYFSEHLFWTRLGPNDTFMNWVSAWGAYSLLAFVFLAVLSYFRIKDIWALFLAGAVFGWLGEGVIVQTAYEMLPLSISFTGLAWHALLTVWIGWYAIQRSLLSADSFSTLKLASVLGLCYGLWAIMWWLEPDGGVSTLAEFVVFSLVTTILVIAAYWLANWSASEPFTPNGWVTITIASLFALYFFFITVPAAPLALIILPILFGLIYLSWRRNREKEADNSLLDEFSRRISIWKFASLLALPIIGIIVYALALRLELRWQTNWILYVITSPLGIILFAISLYKSWFRNQQEIS